MLKKQFEFNLVDGLKYSQDGNFVVAKKLLLSAPSSKQIKIAAKLEQFYKRAINEQQELILKIGFKNIEKLQEEAKKHKKSSDKEEALTAKQVLETLQSASCVNFEDCLEIFNELLTSGVCLVDGKIEMQSIHRDFLSYDELKKLLGEYIAIFFS